MTKSLLKLQIGPVQEFIAPARSTRDLWSGSYLISWMMATRLNALYEEVDPDVVILPKLLRQPLFDPTAGAELWKLTSPMVDTL